MTALPHFDHVRVLCVGDVMLDRFAHGEVRRISPESPVPVIHVGRTTSVPGGAANVARNVSALMGRCTLIGVVGDDPAGRELSALLSGYDRIDTYLTTDPDRPTVEKVRFVAAGQQLLRADWEEAGTIGAATADAVIARSCALMASHDVLVLSDYAKGVLTDRLVAEMIAAARRAGLPVLVDPKSENFARYAGADVLTPNADEIALATGIFPSSAIDAERAGVSAVSDAAVGAVLITRAEQGMSLIDRAGIVVHLPASVREVADVVGAGDTVVGTLALCLGAGMPLSDAAYVANAAAGIAVSKRGTATPSRSELVTELTQLGRTRLAPSDAKVLNADTAARLRRDWGEDGLSVGFTNGCFDILHAGHAAILEFARGQCDRLIVGINADRSVSRLKGANRPVNPQLDRARLVSAFGFVDAVVIFSEDTPLALISLLQPDVLVKGSDYAVEDIVGHDLVRARGGRVMTFDLIHDRSTTGMIDRVSRGVAAKTST